MGRMSPLNPQNIPIRSRVVSLLLSLAMLFVWTAMVPAAVLAPGVGSHEAGISCKGGGEAAQAAPVQQVKLFPPPVSLILDGPGLQPVCYSETAAIQRVFLTILCAPTRAPPACPV